jgi:hypothetical protein
MVALRKGRRALVTTHTLTIILVDILGKYLADKEATLLKDSGQADGQAASQLCEFVVTQLKADPDFAAHLSALLEEYTKASKAAGQDCVVIAEQAKDAIAINNTQSRYSSDRFEP